MSLYYLDTSIAVHALALELPQVGEWLDHITRTSEHHLVSSRLLRTELIRVLRREGRPLAECDEILGNIGLLPISESVLTIAESITGHVKTLDAIHLASAIYLGSTTIVVSHDQNLKRVAATLGLEVFDPA